MHWNQSINQNTHHTTHTGRQADDRPIMAVAGGLLEPEGGEPEGAAKPQSPSTTERGQQRGVAAAVAITRAPFLKRKELAFEPNHASTAMVSWLVGETPPCCVRCVCACDRAPYIHAHTRHSCWGTWMGTGSRSWCSAGSMAPSPSSRSVHVCLSVFSINPSFLGLRFTDSTPHPQFPPTHTPHPPHHH